jgi:hypothetical protein
MLMTDLTDLTDLTRTGGDAESQKEIPALDDFSGDHLTVGSSIPLCSAPGRQTLRKLDDGGCVGEK